MSSTFPPIGTSLDALLSVKDEILTVTGNSVQDGTFTDQLARLTNSAPIVITSAVRTVEGNVVRVTGKAAFLNVSNLDVVATASIDANGPVVTLRFTLIGEFCQADAWCFSHSFPNLPTFYVKTPGNSGPMLNNFLDQLVLSDAAFILTNALDSEDPVTGAALAPGLNFVADCKPTGLLGLLETVATGASSVVISGQIIFPKITEMTAPCVALPSLKFPWQLSEIPPGIHLKVDLNVDKTFYNQLRLHEMGLRLYCPLTQAWQDMNPTYQPILAGSARCDVPSAKISLDLTATGITSTRSLTLFGLFEGMKVEKLESLIDLTGTGDLGIHLPDDIQKELASLEQLSLKAIYIQLGKNFNIDMVGVAIGLNNPKTKVLPGFTVNNILANFMIGDPFGPKREIGVELEGGITFLNTLFDITLNLSEIYAVAEMKENAIIPLGTLFKEVSLPEPPNLTIDTMRLEVGKEGAYALSGSVAESPGWSLNLGPTTLTVSDVQFRVNRPVSANSSGGISGQIAFGKDLIFGFNYELPGDFMLRGQFPEVKLSELVGLLTNQTFAVPLGFDVNFMDSVALVQKGPSSLCFQLATTISDVGTLAFEARRDPNSVEWGFALGVDFIHPHLSSLPGLTGLKMVEDIFNLTAIEFVVTSLEDPNFQFPSLAVFNNPVIPMQGVSLPQSKGGLIPGFNAYALWTLDNSKEQNLLRMLLGLNPSLAITLQIGEKPDQESRLYVDYQTKLEGHPLDCQFGGQIKNGGVDLFLKGNLTIDIQGQITRFDVELLFVANGAFISGSMVGSVKFEGITLSDLALVIGADWEGVPSLGIAATITDASFQSSLAIFFNSANPSESLLAGSISNLSLKNVADTFTQGEISEIDPLLSKFALIGTNAFKIDASLAKALDNLQLTTIAAAFAQHGITLPTSASQVLLNVAEVGQKWFLTSLNNMMHYELDKHTDGIWVSLEPQFYCAPKQTFIGTYKFDQGFYLNTGFQFLFLKGAAKILIKPDQGVSIDGNTDPVIIGTEKLFSLSSKDGKAGPRISVATFSQSDLPDPYKKPHFFIDSKMFMLGLERDLLIEVSTSGFKFDMDGTLMAGVHYDLKGAFSSLKDLNIEGEMALEIGTIDLGLLGCINIDTGVKGDLNVGVQNGSTFAKFNGSFSFAGQGVSLPAIDLDVNTSSLFSLLDEVTDTIKNIFLTMFKDVKKWLDLCSHGLLKGVASAIQVLKDFYLLSGEAATAALKEAGCAVEQISAGLKATYQFTAEQVMAMLKTAGYATEQIATGLKTAYQFTADQAAAALKSAGYAADQVASGLKTAYGLTADEAIESLKAAGYTVDQVASGLKTAYGFSADQMASALRGAGYVADQVAFGLKIAYGLEGDQVAIALRAGGYAVEQVGGAIKNVFDLTKDGVNQVLNGIGYSANEVGKAIQSVFDSGSPLNPGNWY